MDGNSRKPVQVSSQCRRHSSVRMPTTLRRTNPQAPRPSSPTSAARQGFSFTDTSQATHTGDSEHSNESNEYTERLQRLRVYRNLRHRERSPIISKFIHSDDLRRHSTHLANSALLENVHGEQCLVVHLDVRDQSYISAIYAMIDHIDKSPVPRPSTDSEVVSAISFEQFLKLSIVLWTYTCRVAHWADIAQSLKDRDYVHDLNNWTADRLVQWLFISLVFNWPDVFEAASGALTVGFSKLEEELSRAEYLPPELLAVMWQRRQDYLQQSYNFLRNIWMELKKDNRRCKMPLADAIDNDLSRDPTNFELSKDLPRDLHKFLSPGKILEQVKQSIRNVRPSDIQTLDPRPDTAKKANSEHSGSTKSRPNRPGAEHVRESLAAEAAKEVWSSAKSIISSHMKRKSSRPATGAEPVMTVAEVVEACDDLLARIEEFQREKLRPLDIHDFDSLRREHVLTL